MAQSSLSVGQCVHGKELIRSFFLDEYVLCDGHACEEKRSFVLVDTDAIFPYYDREDNANPRPEFGKPDERCKEYDGVAELNRDGPQMDVVCRPVWEHEGIRKGPHGQEPIFDLHSV